MEAIHLAQSAIITNQRDEIEALKKTLRIYRKKYYDNQDTILNLKTRIFNYYTHGEQP